MGRRDKNGLPTDSVHVDTGSSLQVIQVDVAIFSNEEDDILFGTDLHKQERNLLKAASPSNQRDTLTIVMELLLPAWPPGSHSVLLGGRKHPQLSLEMVGCPLVESRLQWCAAKMSKIRVKHTGSLEMSGCALALTHTFPPACPRTAKQNRVDSSVLPSILNCAKPAACPSMGCDTFLSTEYSCMAPTTRFCYRKKSKKKGEMEERPKTAEFVLSVGSQGFSSEQCDFINISQGCIWRSTQPKQHLSSNWHLQPPW